MADDTEKLVVALEARVADFERQMQRAERTASGSYDRMRRGSMTATRAMEQDMLRATTRINQALAATGQQVGMLARTFASGFAGGIFAGGLVGIVRGARSVVSELSEIAKAADRVGLSTKNFQELEFGMKLAGIEANGFRQAMEQFTDRIGEAATRGGRLAQILQANGVAIRNARGEIRPTIELLRDFANLVKNAAGENEAMILTTEAFGDRVGRQLVTALRNGEAAIDDMTKAAADAGGTIDEELLRKAEEFDDRWAAGWRSFEVLAKSGIMNVLAAMDELSSHSIWGRLGLANLPGGQLIWGAAGRLMGGNGADPAIAGLQRRIEQMREMQRNAADLGFEASETAAAVAEAERHLDRLVKAYTAGLHGATPPTGPSTPGASGPQTVIPSTEDRPGRPGRASRRNAAADAALREAAAVQRLIETLQHELSLVGMSERERARMNALRQAGAGATEEQRAAIIRLVDHIYDAQRAEQDLALQVHARAAAMEHLATSIGDTLGGAFSGVFSGAIGDFDTFVEHMASSLARLAEDNIQKLFDFSSSGMWAQQARQGSDDNEHRWAGMREATRQGTFEGSQMGAFTGMLQGLGLTEQQAGMAGAGLSAGLGGFGLGFQSQSPLMGALGGAMSGFSAGMAIGGVGGPIGAIVGARAGRTGPVFTQERKAA